jgi:hypothetical protein
MTKTYERNHGLVSEGGSTSTHDRHKESGVEALLMLFNNKLTYLPSLTG